MSMGMGVWNVVRSGGEKSEYGLESPMKRKQKRNTSLLLLSPHPLPSASSITTSVLVLLVSRCKSIEINVFSLVGVVMRV